MTPEPAEALVAGEWGRPGGHGALVARGDGHDGQMNRGAAADGLPGLAQRPLAPSAKVNMTLPLTDHFTFQVSIQS